MLKSRKIEILQEANQVLFDTDTALDQNTMEVVVNMELAINLEAAIRHIKMLEKQNELLTKHFIK